MVEKERNVEPPMVLKRLRELAGSRRVLAGLVAVNVIVFVVCAVFGLRPIAEVTQFYPVSWLGLPSGLPALASRWWTPLTYMVTHTDIFHLLFNMLWLWWFGEVLSATQTPRRLWLIYLLGGISGAIFYMLAGIVLPGVASTLIGASAAVLSMMTSAAVISPDVEFRLFLIGRVKLKWLAIVCVVLAFLGVGGGGAGGSQSAHLGGVVSGLLYGIAYRKGWRIRIPEMRRRGVSRSARKAFSGSVQSGLSDEERLDQLLDKIRLSGFSSLSRKEQNELQLLSRRLGR